MAEKIDLRTLKKLRKFLIANSGRIKMRRVSPQNTELRRRLDDVLLDRLLIKRGDHLSLFTAPAALDRDYDAVPEAYEAVIDAVRQSTPCVIVDMPHIWTPWVKSCLIAADDIVMVATPDLASLRNIHGTLRPGGRAIILVPHDQRVFCKLDEVLGHFRRYSHDQLRSRMQEAGFEVETILDFNRVSRPGWYLNGKLLGRSKITRAQLKLFDRLVWLWRRMDRYLPWPPTSIIAIGRKI